MICFMKKIVFNSQFYLNLHHSDAEGVDHLYVNIDSKIAE